VEMDSAIRPLNHVVHVQAIVAHVHQARSAEMAHALLEKIVEHVQAIVGHAVQRAHPWINMDLCQEANAL